MFNLKFLDKLVEGSDTTRSLKPDTRLTVFHGVNNEKLVEILKTSYGLQEILDLLKMPRKLELRLKEYVRKIK